MFLPLSPAILACARQDNFHFTIAHPSSSAADLLVKLNIFLSLFSQLGHPRGLHDNACASCGEGEAVHGEHRSAGSGGQRAWEGKEILSLIMFPSGPAFLENSLLYGNIFGAQHALLFCQASGGGKKPSLHCWKGVHRACCLCCEFLMAAFQLAVPALSKGRGSCVRYWQSGKP